MRLIRFILLLASIVFSIQLYSQGCNDAGLCSMGELDGRGFADNDYNTLLTYNFGLGEQQSLINTIELDQRFPIFKKHASIFIQLPFTYVYGKLGQTYGVGDISIGINYTYLRKKELRASVMMAAQLPPDAANKTIDNKGAPMVYQTSLGIYDLAWGASLFYRKWQFGLGYLKPLGSNKNDFNPMDWPDNEDASEYIQMKDLAMGDDAMLRINRYFDTKKNRYTAGLLFLYRIQKDKITQNGERIALDGSEGLTLNINLGYYKVLKNKDAITLTLAAPLITREVRVDGLTRTFIVMLTYAFGKKEKGLFDEIKLN